VTDPPYELGFMGKSWDSTGIAYDVTVWAECLRVLKPGGHVLAFGGSRTWHRLAVAVEDAGFELRDCLMWLYGSGFPKGLDIGKKIPKWEGWNTLDIPYRKKDSEADIFIMHNSFWNTLAVIMMKKVKDSTVNQKNAKCSNVKTNKESFFNVSLKDVRFFKAINENKTEWVEISENGNLI